MFLFWVGGWWEVQYCVFLGFFVLKNKSFLLDFQLFHNIASQGLASLFSSIFLFLLANFNFFSK